MNYSKRLPLTLKAVQSQKLDGVMLCCRADLHQVQLYFRQGTLFCIQSNQAGLAFAKILDDLLGWEDFSLDWEDLPDATPEANVNLTTWQAFQEVLELLTESNDDAEIGTTPQISANEENRSPMQENPKNGPEQKAPVVAAESPVYFVTAADPNLAVAPVETSKKYLIEVNLLLPPGQHQHQLEELLGQSSFEAQLKALVQHKFTGYVYYVPEKRSNPSGNFGLALLIEGQITELLYELGSPTNRLTGQAAYKTLSALSLKPQIYKVDIRLLRAYRALLDWKQQPRQLSATPANFSQMLKAFEQAGRDGVVQMYASSLKLHYFFLFEGGKQVGVFGADYNSGRLHALSAPLALPATDPAATLVIMLASRANSINLTASANPVSNILPSEPDVIAAVAQETLSWQGGWGQKWAAPMEKKTESRRTNDDFNPYDF